jgi:hypothetical protein
MLLVDRDKDGDIDLDDMKLVFDRDGDGQFDLDAKRIIDHDGDGDISRQEAALFWVTVCIFGTVGYYNSPEEEVGG